jgi:hypothetical protein
MRLQFVGCGDAFGSGGRLNTCFHVIGDRVLRHCERSEAIHGYKKSWIASSLRSSQ